jgi:hypothetical protein
MDQAARLTKAAGVRTTPPDQRKAGHGGSTTRRAPAKRPGTRGATPLEQPLYTPKRPPHSLISPRSLRLSPDR